MIRTALYSGLKIERLEARVLLSSDPFLATNGTLIRDGHGTGDPVLLQGTNLGGWLVTEGWMTPRDSSGLPDDYSARQTLIDRFGAAIADNLINTYEDAWVTAQDLDNIKALGMNVIRLPFWYRNLENEDGSWRADAFDRMDWLVSNAWARGIYTILDFHGVVGGQSTAEHTGRVRPTAEFWSSSSDQQRTIDIWQQIAAHFQGNPGVAGYDLINEPIGAPSQITLWNTYDRFYQAIRAVDPDHMVIMEGTWNQWDWDMLPNPALFGWTNVVYEMHEYQWGSTNDPNGVRAGTDRQVNDFLAHQSWNVPCYVGEFNDFGPGSDPTGVWQYAVQQFQNHNMSWSTWSYKATHGSGSDSWGIYDRLRTPPPIPNLQTDSAETIAGDWSAWSTDNAFAINPMLEAALSVNFTSTLPGRFVDQDINAPGRTGGAAYDRAGRDWIVWGSGSDIWGSADQFNYAAKPVQHSRTISALVTSLANTDPWAKAGVMLRDSWDADAMFADVLATESNGLAFQWRDSTGGSCGSITVPGIPAPTPAAPLWVKLVKSGNIFSGFYSTDGFTWNQIGSDQPIAFDNATYLAGLAVTSHNDSALNAATFTNVKVDLDANAGNSTTALGSAPAIGFEPGPVGGVYQEPQGVVATHAPLTLDTINTAPGGPIHSIGATSSPIRMLNESVKARDRTGMRMSFDFWAGDESVAADSLNQEPVQ
jgi:aryl-phospho-beta-D-glucosidase BglC (GH1 family)